VERILTGAMNPLHRMACFSWKKLLNPARVPPIIPADIMNERDQRRYERLTRVQTFGRDNAADFSAASKARTHLANIDSHILSLDRAKAGQVPARVSKQTLLDALALDLENIARTARSIELTNPGFAAPYRSPDSATERGLTTNTDAVLQLLEEQINDSAETKTAKAALRARFMPYELPSDFVANLRADREAITETNQHNQGEVQGGVENTELIGHLLGQAGDDVTELDAIMHNKYTRQPEKLRGWQSASRVERAPQREKKVLTVVAGGSAVPTPLAA
jgi:hypothetical protein